MKPRFAAAVLFTGATLTLSAGLAWATTTAYPEPAPCAQDFAPVADTTINTDLPAGSCEAIEAQSGGPSVHVYMWNHVSIPAGVTVTFIGSRVPEIRSPNPVQIEGGIDVSASASAPGPGGGARGPGGGVGIAGSAGSPVPTGGGGGQPGTGGTAGTGGIAGANGGHAGLNASVNGSGGGGGGAGSRASATPLVGGAGGGGGGGSTTASGGNGGSGGGAISVFSDASIDVGPAGFIAADGAGGSQSSGSGGGGGGGSGGAIVLIAPQVSLESGGVLQAKGGLGAPASPGAGAGGAGAGGLIRVESLSFTNAGSASPTVTTASFAAASLDVSTTGAGSGSVTSSPTGIDCPGDCHELYDNGQQVALTATPDVGSFFAGWNGGPCTGSNATCMFDASGGQSVTADFEPLNTFIDSGPSGTTHDPTPTFTFHADDPSATFECKVDGGTFAGCTSPDTLSHLGDGSHTFMVRAVNSVGPDPTPASRTFTVDTVPPTGGHITTALPAFTLTSPFTVAWGGATDSSTGVKNYKAYSRRAPYNGGFGSPVLLKTTLGAAGGSTSFSANPANTYCFYVTVTDNAGNASTSASKCTAMPVDDAALTGSGWSRHTGQAGYYRGTYSASQTKGATLSLSAVQAKTLALVATKCPGCGAVQVLQGGILLKQVSLAATTTQTREIIPVASFGSVHTGTVVIKVTSTGKPVLIDGLGVSR